MVGVPDDQVFTIMDDISNAIADSCEPLIIPDISMRDIDGKTVIVAEILPGAQRPYFIKSMGRELGTFVRVADTTRQADVATTKELLFEGSNRSFDQGTENARKMHSNGVECTDSALNVHGESTNSESMARLDEQQRKVLDMLVQNGPMKSSSIADQLGVQKKTCDRHTE